MVSLAAAHCLERRSHFPASASCSLRIPGPCREHPPADPTSWLGPAPAAPKPGPEGVAADVTVTAALGTLVGDIIFERPVGGSTTLPHGTTRLSMV